MYLRVGSRPEGCLARAVDLCGCEQVVRAGSIELLRGVGVGASGTVHLDLRTSEEVNAATSHRAIIGKVVGARSRQYRGVRVSLARCDVRFSSEDARDKITVVDANLVDIAVEITEVVRAEPRRSPKVYRPFMEIAPLCGRDSQPTSGRVRGAFCGEVDSGHVSGYGEVPPRTVHTRCRLRAGIHRPNIHAVFTVADLEVPGRAGHSVRVQFRDSCPCRATNPARTVRRR